MEELLFLGYCHGIKNHFASSFFTRPLTLVILRLALFILLSMEVIMSACRSNSWFISLQCPFISRNLVMSSPTNSSYRSYSFSLNTCPSTERESEVFDSIELIVEVYYYYYGFLPPKMALTNFLLMEYQKEEISLAVSSDDSSEVLI